MKGYHLWICCVMCLLTTTGCKQKPTQPTGTGNTLNATLVKTLDGFTTPECMVPDGKRGVIYVSNVATDNEGYWVDDGVGFISTLNADGSLKELKWIDSTETMQLHAPKGMCIQGDCLYINDNTRLLRYHLETKKLEPIDIPGAQRLNDLAAEGSSAVLTSDVAAGKLYRVTLDNNITEIPAPEAINGVTAHNGKIFAVSWGLHDIYELDPQGQTQPSPFGLADHFTALDAIEVLDDGSFIVSDFKGNKVCAIGPDRKQVTTLVELTTPADLGIDRKKNLLYIPQLTINKIAIYKLSQP